VVSSVRPGAGRGTLLLADISGYTAFLEAVGGVHGEEMRDSGVVPAAYPLMTSLLDGIVEKIVPPFILSKFEGDAVFAFAPDGELALRSVQLLACLNACYAAFLDRLADTRELMWCSCAACSTLSGLDLKFVLHHGEYVALSIAGHEELLGPDVTIAHRLMKNHAAALVGGSAYALLTEAAAGHSEVPLDDALPLTEEYEHVAPIRAYVFRLGSFEKTSSTNQPTDRPTQQTQTSDWRSSRASPGRSPRTARRS
jgi:class 3 adenylate cyclase